MKQMKTLTVNGVTYAVTDPTAARIDDTVVGDATWSAKKIVDVLCPAFSETGAIVTCTPVEGYPLEVTADSPVTRCGKNLFDFTKGWDTVKFPGSSGGPYTRVGFAISLPAGTYTLHTEPKTSTPPVHHLDGWHMAGVVTKADGTYQETASLLSGAAEYTRTVTIEQGGKIYIYHGYSGPSEDQVKELFGSFDVQIEVGSKATVYAPYNSEIFNPGDTIPALPGVNTLWAESGSITVTGRAVPPYAVAEAGGEKNGI